jgi:hypothetical protein
MIVGIGGAGYGMEVEVNTDTVLPAPLEDANNVPKNETQSVSMFKD